MATVQHNFPLISCPRDNPSHNEVLNIFKAVTPTNCQFSPTMLWAIHSRKKKSTCRWKVLYVLKDPQMNIYRQRQQAQQLRDELLQSQPMNCTILDYEFYEDQINNLNGWLMTWRVYCQHTANFRNIHEGLPMINYV